VTVEEDTDTTLIHVVITYFHLNVKNITPLYFSSSLFLISPVFAFFSADERQGCIENEPPNFHNPQLQ